MNNQSSAFEPFVPPERKPELELLEKGVTEFRAIVTGDASPRHGKVFLEACLRDGRLQYVKSNVEKIHHAKDFQ